MFKKWIAKFTQEVKEEITANSKAVTAEVLQRYQEKLEADLATSKRIADERKAKMDEQYAQQCITYDKISREIQQLTAVAEERRKELVHQTQRMEADIVAMRAGTPDRLWEQAYQSGYGKGFDLALTLQAEQMKAYVAQQIKETVEKERARYDEAIAKLRPQPTARP